MFEDDKAFERNYSVNKKSKMINTYGKSKTTTIPKRTTHFTGSLSDRLQLIDTTPTGEDPYQLGEADMREQSPIPKLMLQKTNHGRMKICSDTMGDSTTTTRRTIYDVPATETSSKSTKIKLENRYNLPSTVTQADLKKEKEAETSNLFDSKTSLVFEPDLELVKTEAEIDWRLNTSTMTSFDCTDADSQAALSRINTDDFHRLLITETSEEARHAVEALESMDLKTLDYCAKVAEQSIDDKAQKCVVGGISNNVIQPDVVPEAVPDVVPVYIILLS